MEQFEVVRSVECVGEHLGDRSGLIGREGPGCRQTSLQRATLAEVHLDQAIAGVGDERAQDRHDAGLPDQTSHCGRGPLEPSA